MLLLPFPCEYSLVDSEMLHDRSVVMLQYAKVTRRALINARKSTGNYYNLIKIMLLNRSRYLDEFCRGDVFRAHPLSLDVS